MEEHEILTVEDVSRPLGVGMRHDVECCCRAPLEYDFQLIFICGITIQFIIYIRV